MKVRPMTTYDMAHRISLDMPDPQKTSSFLCAFTNQSTIEYPIMSMYLYFALAHGIESFLHLWQTIAYIVL